MLLNALLAEAITNFHSFLMIVPNHAGDDLYRFDGPVRHGQGEFYLRQIVGSVNYRCGGDGNDVMHGWLNYQIEHHVWPDLTLRQYRRAQPRLKALCELPRNTLCAGVRLPAVPQDGGNFHGRRENETG